MMILAAASCLLLSACGGASQSAQTPQSDTKPAAEAAAPAETPEAAPAETPAEGSAAETPEEELAEGGEDDWQNPVMNFIGNYGCGRAGMLVEAGSGNEARFTVTWGSSAWEASEWTMSGELDTETLTVAYSDCVRTDRTYAEDGSVAEEIKVYQDGSGTITFDPDDYSLTWQDDVQNIAQDMVFTSQLPADFEAVTASASEIGDADHYTGVTALPPEVVEEIARSLKQAYLDEDWSAFVNMIDYPITMYPDVKIEDADAFMDYVQGKHVHESDRAAMEEENCVNMFANGQGICMGSGQIWLNDASYMTDEVPELKIIAISGIVES